MQAEMVMSQRARFIMQLIHDREFDSAELEIANARACTTLDDLALLLSLEALLEWTRGNRAQALQLQSLALAKRPDHLPLKYQMACFLFEDDNWEQAELSLRDLISASTQQDDEYFLDDARFHHVICLQRLGRDIEARLLADEISDDTSVFLLGRLMTKADLLKNG